MQAGDTVIMLNLSDGNPVPHLWFVITDPDPATHLCAMVSLTTLKNDKDQTVVLHPGEHPFIMRTSTIYFSGAIVVDVRVIETRIAEGKVRSHARCSPKLLKLLQEGVAVSPFTPKKVITFCRTAFGPNE